MARRSERVGDASFLFSLFTAAQGEVLAGLDPALRHTLLRHQYGGQNAVYRAAHPDGRFEVVEIAGAPVGRLVTAVSTEGLMLVDVALLPGWRGRGLGTHLLRLLQDEARSAGVPLRLSVLQSNAAARRLYERLGFVPAGAEGFHLDMTWMP